MRRLALVLVLGLAVALAGCNKGGDGPAAPAGPSKEEQLKTFQEKVLPQVQAAVPADAPKVEFEAKLTDKDTAIAAVPKGWKESVIPGTFEPPEGSDIPFMTQYGVGSNCDGSCSPKDWKATAEKVEFAQFKDPQFKIEKDEALKDPEGRLLVASVDEGKKLYIVAARWKEGASRYYTCRATLVDKATALRPAVERACVLNIPLF